ncbi:MAG: hypothetical protein C0490_05045 [Marivirga sp.]|nr:hypothetical protein [Marivirga sp.]
MPEVMRCMDVGVAGVRRTGLMGVRGLLMAYIPDTVIVSSRYLIEKSVKSVSLENEQNKLRVAKICRNKRQVILPDQCHRSADACPDQCPHEGAVMSWLVMSWFMGNSPHLRFL